MKKIFTSILILVSVVSFSACNFTKFDGSRTGNESQLIMQYDVLNMTDSQKAMKGLDEATITTVKEKDKLGEKYKDSIVSTLKYSNLSLSGSHTG
mgnify:CR=1 FL=1